MAGRHRKAPPRRADRSRRGRHRKPAAHPRALPTVAAVAVLAVGGVAFGHAVAQGQAPRVGAAAPLATPRPVIGPGSPTAPPPAASPRRTPTPRSTTTAPRHPVRPAAMALTDVGADCYLQVTSRHGHVLVRRILHHGQHVDVRGHGFDVVLGNAGGVRISIHGRPAHRAGRSGQVRQFRVG